MDDFDFGGFSPFFHAPELSWARGADFGIGPLGPWMSDVAFVSDGPVSAAVDVAALTLVDVAAFEDAPIVDAPLAASSAVVSAYAAAETPLFTAFDWPEQARFAFDNDDAFVAPVRFAGRTFFSWL